MNTTTKLELTQEWQFGTLTTSDGTVKQGKFRIRNMDTLGHVVVVRQHKGSEMLWGTARNVIDFRSGRNIQPKTEKSLWQGVCSRCGYKTPKRRDPNDADTYLEAHQADTGHIGTFGVKEVK